MKNKLKLAGIVVSAYQRREIGIGALTSFTIESWGESEKRGLSDEDKNSF
jgi:hypothetical protein